MLNKKMLSLILACLALIVLVIPTSAVPPLPSSFWGQIKVNGQNTADGLVIQALIGGKVFATATTRTYQGNSVYSLDIPGDDPSTPEVEGGKEGDTVHFKMGNLTVAQTGGWHSGENAELNLTGPWVTNLTPHATNDTYTLTEDGSLHVPANGVLGNDSDGDYDPLTAVKGSDPQHGTLTLNVDGSFDYRPGPDYNGQDAFTYFANDGKINSAAATVNITIYPVNDAPAADEGQVTTLAGRSVDINLGLLALDQETGAANLTYIIDSSPSHGTITSGGPVWKYIPDNNFTGTDTVRYHVIDRGDPDACTGTGPACSAPLVSTQATITITVSPHLIYLPFIKR